MSVVDTKKVSGRRKLRFNCLDDVLADLDMLEGKRLRTLGNWSVGQIMAHLSIPMHSAIDGTMKFKPPWYIRSIARLFKRQILNGTAPAGFQLSKEGKEELVPGPTGEAEGFAALRQAIDRLKTTTHREPSGFLGKLTVDEWNKMMCRHCELHLSFIVPEA